MPPPLDTLGQLSSPSTRQHAPLFRDNPILARENRRFIRAWWGWFLLISVAWFPLMFVTRSQMLSGTLPAQLWQQILLLVLATAFRPDVLLGFFLAYRLTAEMHSPVMRQQIAVTLLTARQIMIGKAWVPVLVLFSLNVLVGSYYYGGLLANKNYQLYLPTEEEKKAHVRERSYLLTATMLSPEDVDLLFGPGASEELTTESLQSKFSAAGAVVNPPPATRNGITIPVAIPVAFLALLEDILFATLVIFVALREYLHRRNSLNATFIGIGWIALLGLGILGCYLAPPIVYEFLPYALQDQILYSAPLEFLFSNSIWFLLVLPFESMLVWWSYRRLIKQMPKWLYLEED